MKINVVILGSDTAANRNFTCDRCGVTIKPRQAPNAYTAVRGQRNEFNVGIGLEVEHFHWRERPFSIAVCKDCAARFAETYRLREYAFTLQRCWFDLSKKMSPDGHPLHGRESAEMSRVMGMQQDAHQRYLAERQSIEATLADWWPALVAKVQDHEFKVLQERQAREEKEREQEAARA